MYNFDSSFTQFFKQVKMERCICLGLCLSFLITLCHGISFTVTPREMEMCGSSKTASLRLTCQPNTSGIREMFAVEIGKMEGGHKNPLAHILIRESATVVNSSYRFRLTHTGSISGGTGRLDVTMSSLVDGDAGQYYCHMSYLADVLKEEQSTEVVTLHTLTNVPQCNGQSVMSAINNHILINASNAGQCSNGISGRPEALLMTFCSAPTSSKWGPKQKVMDVCCQIPLYTPVATFEFGLFVPDERGMAGIFLGCNGNGFDMATQLCGHPPRKLSLQPSNANGYIGNANNYHIVDYNGGSGFLFNG